ncbi:hypothetical protein AOLI_G00097130 [Acnodon oligacanthus]
MRTGVKENGLDPPSIAIAVKMRQVAVCAPSSTCDPSEERTIGKRRQQPPDIYRLQQVLGPSPCRCGLRVQEAGGLRLSRTQTAAE